MKIFLNNVGHKKNVPPMTHFQEGTGGNTLLKRENQWRGRSEIKEKRDYYGRETREFPG